MQIFNQLENIKGKFIELGKTLSDPSTMSDMKRFTALNKEYRELGKIVEVYDKYQLVLGNIDNNKKILETEKDEDFRDMAKGELIDLEPQKEKLEEELKQLLIPKEPEDERNVLLEIRAGTGGDEAAIFAGDLARIHHLETDGQRVAGPHAVATVLGLQFGAQLLDPGQCRAIFLVLLQFFQISDGALGDTVNEILHASLVRFLSGSLVQGAGRFIKVMTFEFGEFLVLQPPSPTPAFCSASCSRLMTST